MQENRGFSEARALPTIGALKVKRFDPSVDIQLQEARLFGYPVHLVSNNLARAAVEQAIERKQNLQVVTLNPEMIMQGDQNPELGRILKSAGLILPDGAGVVWALRKRGLQVDRLPGIEFSEGLLQWSAEVDHSVAIVGASREALDLAIKTLTQRYPKLNIVYSHHGFFKPGEEEERIAQACAAAQPKIALVALGVPRQEQWIDQHKHLFHGTTFVGVGGSLDVWSGKTQRAPSLMRRLNLEWMYRITTEPWRIKRTYKTLPLFVVKVLLSRGNA
jgi:N-acetylglucosaminyldiphosphoundecaprenol N-acetyl-beta-D-mannosaminyltransferase